MSRKLPLRIALLLLGFAWVACTFTARTGRGRTLSPDREVAAPSVLPSDSVELGPGGPSDSLPTTP